MMKNSYDINQKIDEILSVSEGINQAEPNSYFYTRLHARMQRELLQPKTIMGFQMKPIYAYSVIMALIIINVFAISNFKNHQNYPSQEDSYSLYQVE